MEVEGINPLSVGGLLLPALAWEFQINKERLKNA